MPKRITIKTIARDLGISHITVSRALSGHPRVSAKTRQSVLEHADSLGYVKSAAAKTLRGEGANIVGLLLPNIVNEFYARFANSLAVACSEKSLQLIIHLTNDDIDLERQALHRLCEVDASDVIMVPATSDAELEYELLRSVNVIQFVRQVNLGFPCSQVLVDDSAAITDAVRHLHAKGHENIAYIGADALLSSGRNRLAAFLDGLEAAGLEQRQDLILMGSPSFSMGYGSVGELLSRRRMTAIVCGGFEISNGASMACLRSGVRFEDDIAFIGYGDPTYYEWISGGLSTIRIDPDLLAEQAAELLKHKPTFKSEAAKQRSLRAELVVRQSTNWQLAS